MTLRSIKDKITGNVIIIGITELIFLFGGERLMEKVYLPAARLINTDDEVLFYFIVMGIYYLTFLIPIALCLLYMFLTNRRSLRVFTEGGFKKSVCAVMIGILVGFLTNSLVSLMALATGAVKISFSGFLWYMPIAIPLVFIQSSCEEILLRGYVVRYCEPRYDWSVTAMMSGMLFVLHHYPNYQCNGLDTVFMFNLFLCGVVMYLMVKVEGNFWICCGFHTAWNFTQMYLLGLPNSGISEASALFRGGESKDTFFYDSVYGNEGCLFFTVVMLVMAAFLLRKFLKNEKRRRGSAEAELQA